MRVIAKLAALALLLPMTSCATAGAGQASAPAAAPRLAVTFDDIPAHGPLPPGVTRLDIVHDITAALKRYDVPAFGFLNGGFGADDPQSPEVIAAWRAAGFPLGNHTFSHLNLSENGAAAFEGEIAKNEPMLAAAMAGADWHWLRFPYLAEGKDAADRDAVRAYLAAHRYRIAAVTMSFGDYAWNDPYAACKAAGNDHAIETLEKSYLAAAREQATRMRAMSQTLYGRDIPYVLLMHLGAFDAHMLPRLLDLYTTLGFTFTSLPEAESDPFYAAATDLAAPGPSPTLERAAETWGVAVPPARIALPDAKLCG